MPSEGGWSGEILVALENKYRDGKFEAKLCRSDGSHLRHEAIAAQLLAISGIIDVSHRIAWSHEREANCPHYELVRALESVRPFPRHAVPPIPRPAPGMRKAVGRHGSVHQRLADYQRLPAYHVNGGNAQRGG